MSLAVSAILHPSRIFLSARLAGAVGLLAICIALAFEPFLIVSEPHLRLPFLTWAVIGAACLSSPSARRSEIQKISIDADGRLFIGRRQAKPSSACASGQIPDSQLCEARSFHGATLLPWFLFIRLRLADGSRCTVRIFRDSVNEKEFRRLAVALRWIVRRNDPAQCRTGSEK